MQHTNFNSLRADFCSRHIGPSAEQVKSMLAAVRATSLDDLISETVPSVIRDAEPFGFKTALSESQALAKLRDLLTKNQVMTSLIGQGYYGTLLPAVIQRNVLENPAWYTAYTPYQPEISQGRLEAMLNFQTMIADLTGLEIANASLLDEATAAAEAMAMAKRVSKSKSDTFFVDYNCHPQTIEVIRTRAEPLGWKVAVGDPLMDLRASEVFGAVMQYPDTFGEVRDLRPVIQHLHAHAAVAVVSADLLALTMLIPPGEMGADIAVGTSQRFGMPLGFGGPHAAYIATRDEHKRSLPGRIVGVSIDSRGRRAYRLALQTREQHIRRERATSNICTAQVLPAVVASMYAVYHGREGLVAIAERVHRLARTLAHGLQVIGHTLRSTQFFDTIVVDVGDRKADVLARAVRARLNLRDFGSHRTGEIGVSLDETSTTETVDTLFQVFGGEITLADFKGGEPFILRTEFLRASTFLEHPVFRAYRSETNLLRYMRKLSDLDLALDRTMIPLGSCTMKLNATTEMMPITWPELCNLHPFAPEDQVAGYAALAEDLANQLCAITGYDAFSLQPNSGAQGEFAGLLAIKAYHRSRGDDQRNICLIPSSAHGTNPASAQMVGMDVVVVACDAAGNVDVEDLKRKASAAGDKLAAIMITYPSTYGVFEDTVQEICEIIHHHGGQVYLDGANLNAQVGLARPGKYGADVSHLNLHKTFCIPHGGGGPGMGPIGVRAHLAPFLPGHLDRSTAVGPVSATPLGSACILAISWTYIAMMGPVGLKRASEIAILNANYIADRLGEYFPVLYRGPKGRVAHECIVDIRPIREATGVTVDDIAKRLIDFGFHAPTMSFPVAGTLMIEPTESESQDELDRFCDAMIKIREEISAIELGIIPVDQSPLRHAPHSALDLADESWDRAYTRMQACFPTQVRDRYKYWAPVNRVDNVFGDRNLVCSCPQIDEYQEAAA